MDEDSVFNKVFNKYFFLKVILTNIFNFKNKASF